MIGERASYRRVFTQSDFDRFARLTGDDNPIHCDPEFAKRSHFGATVSHGMLLYSCISKACSELIPGPGAVPLTQELMFPNPTYVGDEITVALETVAENNDGTLELDSLVSKPGAGSPIVTAQGRARIRPRAVRQADVPAAGGADSARGDPDLHGLRTGMSAAATRVFSAADLEEYGDLIGDRNPLYRDDSWAQAAGFARRIVPAPLLAGMFSDLLGTRLPGRGTGWMKQRLRFASPAYPDDALTARLEITRLRADKELVNLKSTITAADGRLVCDGEALVLVRNLEARLMRKV